MRKLFFLFLISSIGLASNGHAQEQNTLSPESREKIRTIEDTLAILAYAVLNDSLSENRFAACRNMIPTLVEALKVENSFHYPFRRLPQVSIQYPQDSSFRVISWQLYVNKDEYRYYGAIQMNTPELKLFPLVDRSEQVQNIEQEILTPDQWYGAVYYRLMEVDSPEGPYYLLFGYDGYRFFHHRKVLDVLHFDDSGKPVFGAPVFVHQEEGRPVHTKNRVYLEYSAEASVRLNYDELLEMIVFDHLIQMPGQYGEGLTQYPDGSYEGYKLERGKWLHVAKIWDQVQEEPPRPLPVLDGKRSRDLFGGKQ